MSAVVPQLSEVDNILLQQHDLNSRKAFKEKY